MCTLHCHYHAIRRALAFSFLCGGILGVGPLPAAGDRETPDLPSPLVLRLPDRASMIYKAKRTRPLPEAELNSANRLKWQPDPIEGTYTRTGDNLSLHAQWEGGKFSEFYLRGNQLVFQGSLRYPDDVRVTDVRVGDRSAPNLSRGDFPEIPALSAEQYVRTESLGPKKAYVFEVMGYPGMAVSGHEAKGLSEAATQALAETKAVDLPKQTVWLDAKTLLPLQFQNRDYLYTYTLDNSPANLTPRTEAFKKAVAELPKKAEKSR